MTIVDHAAVWGNCLQTIKRNVNVQSFKTWFEPIKPVALTEQALTIQVPNKFFYEWLEEHYVSLLKMTIKKELGDTGSLKYQILMGKAQNGKPKADRNDTAVPGAIDTGNIKNPFVIPGIRKLKIDPQLNPNYTFDNFIEGDCNRLARSAGHAIAARPGGTAFNPLVVFGDVGLGKTHLAHAIGNEVQRTLPNKSVLFVSTEKFTNQIIDEVMAFLHAARYGIQMNAKNRDWRLFQDRGIASPVGRLLPLPTGLISYVRELGVQNIVRGTEFDPRETETLLRYAAETDWTKTPGFLWYDYETDRFSAIPRHPGGHDDGKAYPTRVVLPESRRSPWPILEVADYYPRGKGFVPECFHPLEVAPDAVPIFPPNSHGAVSAVPSQYGGESIVAPADERGLVSYDDEDVPAPVPVAHLRSALPPRRGVGATQSAVAVVDDVVEVPASSPPTGATDNFVAARPELVMETFDQVDVPPIVDEDLKAAWKDYLENARNYGAEPAATVPAVLRQAATLIRDSHTLERTRSALNEVQSALSGILQARVRDVTDGAISDVLVRFGLEPDRSAGGGADGASASNSTGGPARKRPRPGTPTSK